MLVDFTELRNRVLAGEEDAEAEALPSPLAAETTGNNITLAALLVGGGVLAVRMLDRIKYEGKIFQPDESGTDYGKFVSVAFGWIPLSFGLGRVSRGVKAQDEIGKYESLSFRSRKLCSRNGRRNGSQGSRSSGSPTTGCGGC